MAVAGAAGASSHGATKAASGTTATSPAATSPTSGAKPTSDGSALPAYEENEEPQPAGSAAYSYDARGNLHETERYIIDWDDFDRIIRVTDKRYDPQAQTHPSPQTVEYFYDAFGRRVVRQYQGHDPDQSQWTSLCCVYDGVKLIEERSLAAGDLVRRYFYRQAVNQLVSVQAATPAGLTEYIALIDERGSLMGVADASGAVLERIHYNSTGLAKVYDANNQPVLRPDGTGQNLGHSQYIPFGYTGMYREPFTGCLHTHFRDYDAVHRIWLSEDPAGYADGLNLNRAYFDVNGVDPLGLDNTDASWGWTDSPNYHGRGSWLNWVRHGGWFGSHASSASGTKIIVQSRILTMGELNPDIAKDLLITQLENEAIVNYLYAAHNGVTEAGVQTGITVLTAPLAELGVHVGGKVAAKLIKQGYIFAKNAKGLTVLAKNVNGVITEVAQQEAVFAVGFAKKEVLAVGKGLPQGITYEGQAIRAVPAKYAEGAWDIHAGNIAANHRYSGVGRGAIYAGTSEEAVLAELVRYGVNPSSVAWVSKSMKLNNVLDLTNPAVRQQLGVSLEQLTGDSYFYTHAIGDFARGRYSGLLVPSAQQAGARNLVIFP
ncbi:MAG: RES domain-containing protein [Phycisphaeraceae bacterium]|nr:RES domain-containing protein [Phycisphaeraceae bacterium]